MSVMRQFARRGSYFQQGIGLIEILIAVLLVSIGFLAAAQMQVHSMRFSQSAYHQSQAYYLATSMIARIRSNTKAGIFRLCRLLIPEQTAPVADRSRPHGVIPFEALAARAPRLVFRAGSVSFIHEDTRWPFTRMATALPRFFPPTSALHWFPLLCAG